MIVQIVEDREISGRWFLAPQQYTFIQKFDAPISLCTSCTKKYDQQNITFYQILYNGVLYNLPYDIVSLISGDEPSPDMRGFVERWEAKRTHDITLKKGEHTDVVKQAKQFLGIRISQKIQVDGNRLMELRELEREKGYNEMCNSEEQVEYKEPI